jgi:hypothetical protein
MVMWVILKERQEHVNMYVHPKYMNKGVDKDRELLKPPRLLLMPPRS